MIPNETFKKPFNSNYPTLALGSDTKENLFKHMQFKVFDPSAGVVYTRTLVKKHVIYIYIYSTMLEGWEEEEEDEEEDQPSQYVYVQSLKPPSETWARRSETSRLEFHFLEVSFIERCSDINCDLCALA